MKRPDGLTPALIAFLLFFGHGYGHSAPLPWGDKLTPLMQAVADGDAARCRTLLKGGADVNATDQYGITPLMEAAAGGPIQRPQGARGSYLPFPVDLEIGRQAARVSPKTAALLPLLLRSGARVNAQDIYGRTALWQAVRARNKTNAALLLARHADPNLTCTKPIPEQAEADQVPPLLLAVGTKQIDMAQLLLAQGADPNARSLQTASESGLTPVSFAVTHEALPMLRLLLTQGGDANAADPGRYKQTLLMEAVNAKKTGAVIALLTYHADLNKQDADGDTALMFAVRNRNRPCLAALLSRRPKLELANKNGDTALRTALGDTSVMEELLGAGAEPDGRPGEGDNLTPLRTACVEGNLAAARVLIAHGANVNARDKFGMTVLMRTAEYGRTDCVQLLLDNGADLAARDDTGSNALIWAVATDDAAPTIALLISRGADIDAKTTHGETALRLAAANGYIHALQAVLPFEPKAALAGDIGQSALKWAVKNKHPDAAQILKNAGVGE